MNVFLRTVAQICNLLFRRFAIGCAWTGRERPDVAPRRRMQFCETADYKSALRFVAAFLLCTLPLAAAEPDAARQKLVQTILSDPAEQPKLVAELADAGSPFICAVLIAWTRDGVYLYEAPGGTKVPVLLEDPPDAEGKARAVRIDNGRFLADAAARALHFSPTDLTPADTDMSLRSAIQQTLDALALSDPDPDARRS